MPKPLPSSLAESLPNPQPDNPTPDEVMRTLGHIGLPGEDNPDRLGHQRAESGDYLDWAPAKRAHERATHLFGLTMPRWIVPELNAPEFDHVEWDSIEESHAAYERLGVQTEVVIAPEGLALSSWQQVFSTLCEWQESHHRDASHKLRRQPDGNGLYVAEEVAKNWDRLARTNEPRWGVWIIPSYPTATVLEVNHFSKNYTGLIDPDLENISHSVLTATGEQPQHPSVEAYLMLQATRFHNRETPIDPPIDGTSYWTWLEGDFIPSTTKQACSPTGRWSLGHGQVGLEGFRRRYRTETGGMRPAVGG